MDARRVVAGLLLGAGLLVGCSGGAEPSTVPSATQTATSSARPTATSAPTTPGVITAEQASAMAKQYYDTINEVAQEGGGVERFSALTLPDCLPCQQQVDRIGQVVGGGNRVEGGEIVIVDTSVDSVAGNTALVRVGTRTNAGRVIDPSGSAIDTLPPDPVTDQVLTVVGTQDGPRVADLVALGARPT